DRVRRDGNRLQETAHNQRAHIAEPQGKESSSCNSCKDSDESDGATHGAHHLFREAQVVIKRIGHWTHHEIRQPVEADSCQHKNRKPPMRAEEGNEWPYHGVEEAPRRPQRRLAFLFLTDGGAHWFCSEPGSYHSYCHQRSVNAVRQSPAHACGHNQ